MVSMAALKAFIFLFLIFTCPNSGDADIGQSLKEGLKLPNPCGKVIIENKVSRKLLGVEELLDYASPDHNRSHEPRIGNPGGRAASVNP